MPTSTYSPAASATAPTGVPTSKPAVKLDEASGPVYSLAWTLDGQRLASAGFGEVKLWNPRAPKSLVTLKGHTGFVWGVAWSPNGQYLATGTKAGEVKIYATAGGQLRQTLLASATIISLAWSPDGQTLAAGDWNGNVTLWDTATWEISQAFTGYSRDRSDVNGLAWSPDGKLLASAHQDGIVRIWKAGTGEGARQLKMPYGWARGVAWSPDGRWLAAGGESGRVFVWDRGTGETKLELTDNSYPVWGVAWAPDGHYLAAGNGIYELPNQGQVYLWAMHDILPVSPASMARTVTSGTRPSAQIECIVSQFALMFQCNPPLGQRRGQTPQLTNARNRYVCAEWHQRANDGLCANFTWPSLNSSWLPIAEMVATDTQLSREVGL